MKIMRTIFPAFIAFMLSTGISPAVLAEESFAALRLEFDSHCIKCHGKAGKVKGKVDLLALKSDNDLLAKPELLEKLLTVLKDHEMPPVDEPPLPEATRTQMVVPLQMMLREALKNQPFESTQIRRMNRFQYNNTVRDLLGLKIDIFALPEKLMTRYDSEEIRVL